VNEKSSNDRTNRFLIEDAFWFLEELAANVKQEDRSII